jgi:hypothetical protein
MKKTSKSATVGRNRWEQTVELTFICVLYVYVCVSQNKTYTTEKKI